MIDKVKAIFLGSDTCISMLECMCAHPGYFFAHFGREIGFERN